MAVRISLLSAALWWAGFTVIPFLGLRDRPPVDVVDAEPGGLVRQGFGQLATTLRDLRGYPLTLMFLLAYLFFNDGIQTVISCLDGTATSSSASARRADRHDPAGPVRRVRRGAAVRPAGRGVRRLAGDPGQPGAVDGVVAVGVLPAGAPVRAVLGAGRR